MSATTPFDNEDLLFYQVLVGRDAFLEAAESAVREALSWLKEQETYQVTLWDDGPLFPWASAIFVDTGMIANSLDGVELDDNVIRLSSRIAAISSIFDPGHRPRYEFFLRHRQRREALHGAWHALQLEEAAEQPPGAVFHDIVRGGNLLIKRDPSMVRMWTHGVFP